MADKKETLTLLRQENDDFHGEKEASTPSLCEEGRADEPRSSSQIIKKTKEAALLVLSVLLLLHFSHKAASFFVPGRSAAADAETAYSRYISKGHRHGHLPSPEEVENLFLKVPNNESAIAASRSYTGFSHVAGTAGDYRTAVLVKNQWEKLLHIPKSKRNKKILEAGSKASRQALQSQDPHVRVWTDTYHVLLNHPVPRLESKSAVYMTDAEGKVVFKAKLQEDQITEDDHQHLAESDVTPFHGYSKNGTATGQLVYAYSGTVDDFRRLKENGVDMAGKIAIVRYGGNFRGLKVKAAQEAGAVGILIYSDPAEDGEITAEKGYLPYPLGPARQPSSLQRGSVQFLSKYPGDPTTPEKPSYKDAKRETPTSLPGIPSLPLSYEDALPLLKSLNQRGSCFDNWKGGLAYQGVDYCSGPSEGNVTLTNDMKEQILPIWNTYALIPGHITDEVVIIGNHRDAWVYGASDPNSGTASVYEIVKGFGKLIETGWKPLRSILIASWDGEEYGLLGSTEFGEDYAEWSKKVVAYLNVDGSVSGSQYNAKASPSLADLLSDVSAIGAPAPPEHAGEPLKVGPLGSGSDFTVFLQHLGIASSDIGYKGTFTDPVYHYHSIYDNEYWMEKYGDPGFHRHVNIAKTLGLAGLRLADTLVLPLNVTRYAQELGLYLHKVKETANLFDFKDISYDNITAAIKEVQQAASMLDQEAAHVTASYTALGDIGCMHKRHHKAEKLAKRIKNINARKMAFERGFIDAEGLPRRSWYKHLGVAPGELLGYGATTFPSITESITISRSREDTERELQRVAEQLHRIASALKRRKHK